MKTVIKIGVIALMLNSFAISYANQGVKELQALNEAPLIKMNKQYIKVALLLDTSNSMDGLIDQAKAQLWEIVNELSYAKCDGRKPNLQIAIYEYGNDNLNGSEGFIRQVLSFSDDLDEISKQLFSLTTKGGNEYCGQVITKALNQLNWNDNADDLKLIFIAGNEPFTQGRISYQSASRLANEKNVTVNTIFCGDYNQGITSYWKNGADLTYGDYMAINHNKTTTYVSSPYDDEILLYNTKLNETYIAYGKIGQDKMKLQSEQDTNAKGYSKANAVGRTVSKSSHLYKNSTWDLVDASKNEDFNYDNLDDNELPEQLRGKTKSQIKAYITKQQKTRKSIQEKIQSLNIKRKEFILKHQKKEANGLESAMINAIKEQAKKKNYKWE